MFDIRSQAYDVCEHVCSWHPANSPGEIHVPLLSISLPISIMIQHEWPQKHEANFSTESESVFGGSVCGLRRGRGGGGGGSMI